MKTRESRSLLVVEGFVFRNISVQVYDSNPYSIGDTGPGIKVIKVTICGLPLSVDDSAVFEMLDKFEINRKSEMKYENIRHPITHRMTNVLNGYRFLYIAPLLNGKSLPRNAVCAKLKCRIYHQNRALNAGRLGIVNTSVRMTGNVESAEKRDMLQDHPSVNTMSIPPTLAM